MQIPFDAIREAAERMAPQLPTVKLRDSARVIEIVAGGNTDPDRALALFAASAIGASEVRA